MHESDELNIHEHEHTHTYTHAHPHVHEDGSVDDGHTHEHTHTYTHSHPHGHEAGAENDHAHLHDYSQEHPHDHDHAHEHEPHHHHHDHGQEKPAAQVYALMRYMAGHNADHTRELADLAGEVREAAGQEAYDYVLEAISFFEKGNAALFKALEKIPDGE